MYSKNDGYIYFENPDEVNSLYYSEEEHGSNWEYFKDSSEWYVLHFLFFGKHYTKYRRRLTPEFKVRTEFREGDPVCWCGCNGVVQSYDRDASFPIRCRFKNIAHSFLSDGRDFIHHTRPSILHGHDVHRIEDSKYPVERSEHIAQILQAAQAGAQDLADRMFKTSQADEVAECIPHWIENIRLASEGEKIDRSPESCPLCRKYRCILFCSKGCPVYQETGEEACYGTPYESTADNTPESCIAMTNWLIELERKLRRAGK